MLSPGMNSEFARMPLCENLPMRSLIHRLPVESLLTSVTSSSSQASGLQEKRQSVLKLLVELMDANAGHWAWAMVTR